MPNLQALHSTWPGSPCGKFYFSFTTHKLACYDRFDLGPWSCDAVQLPVSQSNVPRQGTVVVTVIGCKIISLILLSWVGEQVPHLQALHSTWPGGLCVNFFCLHFIERLENLVLR